MDRPPSVPPSFSLHDAVRKYPRDKNCLHVSCGTRAPSEENARRISNTLLEYSNMRGIAVHSVPERMKFWGIENPDLVTEQTFQVIMRLIVESLFPPFEELSWTRSCIVDALIIRDLVDFGGLAGFLQASQTNTKEMQQLKAKNERIFRKIESTRGLLQVIDEMITCSCLKPIIQESLKSAKTDQCHYCMKDVPIKKLKMCSRCTKGFYCSEECQRKAYPDHKIYCRQIAKHLAQEAEKEAKATSSGT